MISRITTIVLFALLLLLGSFNIFCSHPGHAQEVFSPDAQKQQAWRLYIQYKDSATALENAENRLKDLKAQAKEAAGGGTLGGGSYLAKSGIAAEMNKLNEKIAALKSTMTGLEASWDKAGFFLPYGPLSDARKTLRDPKTKALTDPTVNRLNYTPEKPTETTKPVWVLKPPPLTYSSAKDNLADYSKQTGSAARGSIWAQEEVHLDKTRPPEIRHGALTWSFSNKPNLISLVPGETLKWTVTVRDTSGGGSVVGNLKFETYGMGGKSTSGGGDIFYGAPANGGEITKSGVTTVPNGKPGDKIMLRGKVVAGRSTMVYDDIYEMTVPSQSSSAPPSPRPSASLSGSWSGHWMNNLGEKETDSLVLEETGDGRISGTWSGNVPVTGKRVNATTIELRGQSPTRAYEIVGTIQDQTLAFRYVARRLNAAGSYEGTATFTRAR